MPLSPRLLRPSSQFTPRSISGLALWLDGSDTSSLYTTDAGAVTAVSSPTDISGCVLWLDGADSSAASMTLNGSLVETWKDKSGGSRDFTASSTARPSLTASTINGRSAVTFNGSTTTMTGSSAAQEVIRNLAGYAAFAVLRTASVAAGERLAFGVGSTVLFRIGQQDSRPFIGGRRVSADALESVTSSSGTISAGAAFIETAVVSHTSQSLSGVFNGATFSTDTTYMGAGNSENAASSVSIGTQAGGAYGFWNGEIAEIIIYNTALSTAQRASVEAYLAAKWGVSGVHAPATTAGDPVGYWADRSGNNRHATQATAASRPTVSAIGNRRALRLGASGAVSRLSLGNLSAAFPSAGNVFVAFQPNNDSQYTLYSTRNNDDTYANTSTSLWGTWVNTRTSVASSRPSSGVHVANLYGTSGLFSVIEDGALIHSSSVLTYEAGNDHNIGSRPLSAAGQTPLDGWIAEVIAYNRALTSAERRKIEQYLANRWGITLAPQVSDPDAQDWVNRVYAAGSTVSQSAAAAVNTFVVGCKDDGIWTAMRKVLLLIGVDTFAGCAAYLKGTAPTFTNFSSANYSRTAGLQGVNTGYIRAAMRVSDLTASNSMHLAAWQTAANTAGATTFLANGQGGGGYLRDNVTNTGIRANSVEVLTINSRGSAGTMIGMSRNSTTQYGIVNGTVTSGASTVNDTGTTTEYDLMGAGTGSSYLGRVSFFSFGDGIDLATLNARVSTLMSTLGSL